MSPKERGAGRELGAEDWIFPFEAELHAVAPGLHHAQSAWLSQIDSLEAPDRKTHELIRMVCTVIRRNPPGVTRHAMLAAEVGATWEEVAGSLMLTEPAFGLLNVVEALPWARRGWEQGRSTLGGRSDGEERPPSPKVRKVAGAASAAKSTGATKATKGAKKGKAPARAKAPKGARAAGG